MNFEWYPFDRHRCLVRAAEIKNSGMGIKYVTYAFSKSDIGMSKRLQFAIEYGWLEDEEKSVWDLPVAGFALSLRRRVYPVALNVICPTLIVTLISVIGFKIPPDSVPGRMGLLVTCFLVIVNIAGSHNRSSGGGAANAFTALDFWVISCQAVVSLGIVEYTFILKMVRGGKVSGLLPSCYRTSKKGVVGPKKKKPADENLEETCSRIDKICFRGLLAVYLLFVCI